MNAFLGELIGTAVLLTLGLGVVANVLLHKSKGQNGGWMVITFGWAMGVYVGVFISAPSSGAHLNPAVTLGLALAGKFAWDQVPVYLLAQMLGAMLGSVLVWLCYRQHFNQTEDPHTKRDVFCTSPAIRSFADNLFSEILGTFLLVFGALYILPASLTLGTSSGTIGLGAVGALPVSLLVLGIGLSIGGPTGYAINPARDLGPRIVHALLPFRNKASSDWAYAWVPVVGPILGALLAAGLFKFL